MNNRPSPVARLLTHPTTLAVIILSALWVIFFWQLWTPTAADRIIFQKGDFPLHYFAYSDYQVERMLHGEIPLWNPYNYGGDPFAANVQWAVWYPPRWIAAFAANALGEWGIEALQFEVAAHYWLVSLMMVAFLRVFLTTGWRKETASRPLALTSCRRSRPTAITGYPADEHPQSIVAACAARAHLMSPIHAGVRGSAGRWNDGALAFGDTQPDADTTPPPPMAYFAGKRLLARNHRADRPIGVTGAVLSAADLAVELTRLSYRTETYHYADKATGYTAPELVQVIWPHLFSAEYWPLYLGVAGFLLAVGAIWRDPKSHAFWIGTIIVTLWLAMGGYSMVYDVFYLFAPGFNTFREQERAASLAVFALVVLAADQIAFLLRWRGYLGSSTRGNSGMVFITRLTSCLPCA
jgi:hypothetical protein